MLSDYVHTYVHAATVHVLKVSGVTIACATEPVLVFARCSSGRSPLSLPLPVGAGPAGRQGLGELVQGAERAEEKNKKHRINTMRCTQHISSTVQVPANQQEIYHAHIVPPLQYCPLPGQP